MSVYPFLIILILIFKSWFCVVPARFTLVFLTATDEQSTRRHAETSPNQTPP